MLILKQVWNLHLSTVYELPIQIFDWYFGMILSNFNNNNVQVCLLLHKFCCVVIVKKKQCKKQNK